MEYNNKAIDNFITKLEYEIISAILNNKDCLQECALLLCSQDFFNEQTRKIYSAVIELNNESKFVSKNTVIDFFNSNLEYQFDNWTNFINQISNNFFFVQDFKTNVELVKNASIKRQLDEFASEILSTQIDFAKYENQIFDLETKFLKIIGNKKSAPLIKMQDVATDYYKKIQTLINNKKEITGTPIGFDKIDKVTNGFQPGDLIILAARPGVGKTALVLNFLYNAAKEIKKQQKDKTDVVVMFSLEMGQEQLCQRLVSMDALVDSSSLRTGNLNNRENEQVVDALNKLSELPILIDDASDLSILDIQTKLKQLKNNCNVKLVVIDYLQLLKGPRIKGAQTNRQQEVSAISRMLKILAREIETPIIAIAQLSRKIEERGSKTDGGPKRPILSDLRESGSIEQDADIVTFLSKIEQDINEEENTNLDDIPVEYIIAKHRNGPTDIVQLGFYKKYGQYHEIEGSKK